MKLLLTKSESDVVRLKALGYAEKQIADLRFNSLNTIKTHVKRAMEKNNLKNGFELVARYAINHPNLFRNAVVALFIAIQGYMIIPREVKVDMRKARTTRIVRISRTRTKDLLI